MSASHEHTTLCVLVGAGAFDAQHPFPDLPGEKAQHNVEAVADVLSRRQGPGWTVRVDRILDPAGPQEFRTALERSEHEAPPDLLVFYYVGHGYRDPHDNDRLYLAARRSDARRIETTALAVSELIRLVDEYGAAESVVLLDCCYSGDALDHKSTNLERPFGTLTSSLIGRVISPGSAAEPLTPFTRALVRTLGENALRLNELGVALRVLSEEEENQPSEGYPWFAAEVSRSGGAGIVLPPGPPLDVAPTDGGPAEDGPPEDGPPDDAPRDDPPLDDPSPDGPSAGEGPPGREPLKAKEPSSGGGQREPKRRKPRRPRWGRSALAGLLALSLAGALAWAVALGADAACPPPRELRMVTAPEDVSGMRALVRDFERSPANRRDVDGAERCRISRFTVYGASLDALTRAFGEAGGWGHGPALAEVGPQPDVWVAQSSAAVSQVRSGLVLPEGVGREFLTYTTLMKDEPVLVLTEPARERLGLPPAEDGGHRVGWRRLREALLSLEPDARPPLYRPNPTVSGVGLVHTIGMYAKEGADAFDGALLPQSETHRLETELISRGRSLAGSEQALCALQDGRPAGALVGMRQALLHHSRSGDCSGSPGPALRAHRYVLTGGPPLDYQLVEVAWPADDRGARASAVARFSDWVHGGGGAESLRRAHYLPRGDYLTPLSDKHVTDLLGRFDRAHPQLRLTVLFDVSGSMRENGRFEAARRAVEESLGRLAESDRHRMLLYPDRADGSGIRELVGEWTPVPDDGAVTLPARSALHDEDDRYADLLGALREVSAGLPEYDAQIRHAVLLVTDGDYVAGKRPRVDGLGAVAADLADRDVPVIVASMRPYGCPADKDTGVIALRSGGQCEPLSGDLAAKLSRHVAALTEGRPT